MWIRLIALVIIASLMGCGTVTNSDTSNVSENNNTENSIDEPTSTDTEEADEIQEESSSEVETIAENETVDTDELERQNAEAEAKRQKEEEAQLKEEEEAKLKAEEEKKLVEQRNSFSMMYYLAITAEEIRTSKDNRVILDDIYTSLLNDINPGAVDEITQDHLQNLRDIIKSYLNISTKRERLQFIHNQEKAEAIRSAIPNPIAILSVTNALDWKKLAATVAYSAVDSYNSYKKAGESADKAFIMSGWELDDEEVATVQKNRDRAFDYMVDMVQEYNLDGLKTLNEKAIEKFATICATENPSEKIKLLKAEESTYNLLGNYWLELADCYFETSQYSNCLECVNNYNNISTGIYRKDFNYLQILPKAIVAAQETYSGEKYISCISEYADAIITNTVTDDWSSRYFAAQVYLDLYAKTKDNSYLDKAYKIVSENVAFLLKEQREINNEYLSDIVEQTVVEPDYRYMTDSEKKEKQNEYKDEQKRVKDYNKALKEKRKTELPSLYEPLIVNAELLFGLSDQMNISSTEKKDIEAILQTDSNGTFLIDPINDAYSFNNEGKKYTLEFGKDEMIIPVTLLTDGAEIKVTVNEKDETKIFEDCVVTKVERKDADIDSFIAHVSSKQLKKYGWTADSKITIEINYADAYGKSTKINVYVSDFAEHWYGDKVVFKVQ